MADDLDNLLEDLLAVLHEQLAAHERLAALLAEKRQTLRSAHYTRLTDLCELENEAVQRIAELEKRRLALVAQVTLHVEPGAAEPLRMGVLAERLPEPWRGKLLVLRGQLVERMTSIREQTGVLRRATESLVNHMRGLAQSVGALCTGGGVYDRHGAPPPPALAVSTFTVTG